MNRHNSIFIKLIVYFIILVIPVYIFATLIFSWSRNIVEKEIKHSTSSHVKYLKESLETEIQRINMLQYDLINDDDIYRFILAHEFMSRHEYYTSISRLQRRLKIIENSNIFIDGVIVHLPGANVRISSNNSLEEFDDEIFATRIKNYEHNYSPIMIEESYIYTVVIFPVRLDYAERKPTFIVETQISQKILANYLSQFIAQSESGFFVYDSNSDVWLEVAGLAHSSIDIEYLDTYIENVDKQNETKVIDMPDNKYLLVTEYSNYFETYLISVIPLDNILNVSNQFKSYIWIFLLSSLCIVSIYAFSTYRSVKQPIDILLNEFKNIENGQLDVRIKHKSSTEFQHLYKGFNNMVRKLNDMIDKVYRQELYAKKAELKQLQTQIDPHFFYNTYFILSRMIKDGDTETASLLTDHIGEYYRYVTRNSIDQVTLEQEIEHLTNYINIQILRFSGKLEVKIEKIPSRFTDCIVPRMILQPIVENSIRHGFKNGNNKGVILVNFEALDKQLDIIIEDNGDNISDQQINNLQSRLQDTSDNNEITGITNIHRRIQIFFGSGSGLFLQRSDLGGLKLRLRIICNIREEI